MKRVIKATTIQGFFFTEITNLGLMQINRMYNVIENKKGNIWRILRWTPDPSSINCKHFKDKKAIIASCSRYIWKMAAEIHDIKIVHC